MADQDEHANEFVTANDTTVSDGRLRKLLENEPDWVQPGTSRYEQLQRQADDRTLWENTKAGFNETALMSGVTLLDQEALPIVEERTDAVKDFGDGLVDGEVFGVTAGDALSAVARPLINQATALEVLALGRRAGPEEQYKEEHYDALIEGIPSQYHDEIFQGDNLQAAQRARSRIMTQLERGRRIGNQYGFSDNLAIFAGGLVDVDLPLMFVTGGGFKAATIAGKTLAASRAIGLSPKAALRMSSATVGANAGLQAGLIVGAADAHWTETRGWTVIAETALASTILGSAGNVLLKGDRALAAHRARAELHTNIARDDPSLQADVNVDPSTATPMDFDAPVQTETSKRKPVSFDVSESTAGAATRPITGAQRTVMNDPAGPVSEAVQNVVDMASNWRHESGWLDQKVADDTEWWTKVAMSDAFNLSTGNFRQLYKSDSAVLNWLAGNVFESPHGLGRGRYTASAGMEFYHRRIINSISREVPTAANEWAKRNNLTWQNSGYGVSVDGVKKFNREVMLEMNDRAMGRKTDRDPDVMRAADAYEKSGAESLRVARGADGQKPLDGFDQIPDRRGYTPYIWKGQQLLDLEKSGTVDRRAVVKAMSVAYETAGMAKGKDAQAVAEAVLARAIAKDTDVDTNLIALLSGDGREFLQDALRRNGMKDDQVSELMERLTQNTEQKGRESFAKSRNEIDLYQRIETKDGSDVRIVDLLDTDMHGVWQRYARRMAGSASLARVGITNKTQRESIIAAAQAEQRSLGEDVMDGDLLRAMLSNFNGGPVHGYFRNSLNEGVGAEIAIAKRMTNLALLGKLGFAQLAETGATVATVGLENWWRRGPAAIFDKELRQGNKELLDDMSYMLGDLGYDHLHFAEWLDLDDVSRADRGDWIAAASRLSAKGQYLQGYTSMFNQVRGHQQRIASMGIVDKVVRSVKNAMDAGEELSPDLARRFQSDLGLNPEDFRSLESLILNGTIEFGERNGKTFVNRLNIKEWDTEFAEVFASSITRNTNQVVQKSMAGEQDAWMHTHWGAIMSHLKTFPLQAMQKQFIRNMRHSDNQALSTVMMGAATAMAAISVRDVIDGKERTMEQRAKMAFGYSNMTGWVPMFYDPTMTALGLEDYRINAYGPHSDYTPPVVTQINRAARLPGAIIDSATGEADWYDRQSLKALPFSNTLGLSRMLD